MNDKAGVTIIVIGAIVTVGVFIGITVWLILSQRHAAAITVLTTTVPNEVTLAVTAPIPAIRRLGLSEVATIPSVPTFSTTCKLDSDCGSGTCVKSTTIVQSDGSRSMLPPLPNGNQISSVAGNYILATNGNLYYWNGVMYNLLVPSTTFTKITPNGSGAVGLSQGKLYAINGDMFTPLAYTATDISGGNDTTTFNSGTGWYTLEQIPRSLGQGTNAAMISDSLYYTYDGVNTYVKNLNDGSVVTTIPGQHVITQNGTDIIATPYGGDSTFMTDQGVGFTTPGVCKAP